MILDAPMSDATVRETRQRLLEAAGEVFAERGFRAATVRDICQPSTTISAIRSVYIRRFCDMLSAAPWSNIHRSLT